MVYIRWDRAITELANVLHTQTREIKFSVSRGPFVLSVLNILKTGLKKTFWFNVIFPNHFFLSTASFILPKTQVLMFRKCCRAAKQKSEIWSKHLVSEAQSFLSVCVRVVSCDTPPICHFTPTHTQMPSNMSLWRKTQRNVNVTALSNMEYWYKYCFQIAANNKTSLRNELGRYHNNIHYSSLMSKVQIKIICLNLYL